MITLEYLQKYAKYKSNYNYDEDRKEWAKIPKKFSIKDNIGNGAIGVGTGAFAGALLGLPVASIADMVVKPSSTLPVKIGLGAVSLCAGGGLYAAYRANKDNNSEVAAYTNNPKGYIKNKQLEFIKDVLPRLQEDEKFYVDNIVKHPYAPEGLTKSIAAKMFRNSGKYQRENMGYDAYIAKNYNTGKDKDLSMYYDEPILKAYEKMYPNAYREAAKKERLYPKQASCVSTDFIKHASLFGTAVKGVAPSAAKKTVKSVAGNAAMLTGFGAVGAGADQLEHKSPTIDAEEVPQ